eukprot:7285204-Heterocapsa_arctica.AAC.1
MEYLADLEAWQQRHWDEESFSFEFPDGPHQVNGASPPRAKARAKAKALAHPHEADAAHPASGDDPAEEGTSAA